MGPLGAILVPSWGLLVPSCAFLGPSWAREPPQAKNACFFSIKVHLGRTTPARDAPQSQSDLYFTLFFCRLGEGSAARRSPVRKKSFLIHIRSKSDLYRYILLRLGKGSATRRSLLSKKKISFPIFKFIKPASANTPINGQESGCEFSGYAPCRRPLVVGLLG